MTSRFLLVVELFPQTRLGIGMSMKFRFSCGMALPTSTRCYSRLSRAAQQESINEGSKTTQVFERTSELRIPRKIYRGFEIGPRSWNQRLASVWQDQNKPQFALTIGMPQNLQGLTFKRMVWTNYSDVTRKLVEVGSVWRFPSTR